MQKAHGVNAWLDHLAFQLRQGLDEVRPLLEAGELEAAAQTEPALAGLSLDSLIGLSGEQPRTLEEQDRVLLAAVRCFRRREKQLWAPVVLRILAPALIARSYWFVLRTPERDPVDILQQMVAETLAAALTVPIKGKSRYMERRIMFEARRRVGRWLRREARLRNETTADPERMRQVVDTVDDEARWDVAALLDSGPEPEDLDLVFRLGVLGESPQEIADCLGLSIEAFKSRLRRARRRLQLLLTEPVPCLAGMSDVQPEERGRASGYEHDQAEAA